MCCLVERIETNSLMLDFLLRLRLYFKTSVFTKYVFSVGGVDSQKYRVQSPLGFGWDVIEQRPGRGGCQEVLHK